MIKEDQSRNWMTLYNMPKDVSYKYEESSKSEGTNLKYCPKCNKVYEHRYEQTFKAIICYTYADYFQKRALFGTSNPDVSDDRYSNCQGKNCSGDKHVVSC